jgi:hypothetical protein
MFPEVSNPAGHAADTTLFGVGSAGEPNGFTGDSILLFCETEAHCLDPRKQSGGNSGSSVFVLLEVEPDVRKGERVGAFGGLEVFAGAKEEEETEPNQVRKGLEEGI